MRKIILFTGILVLSFIAHSQNGTLDRIEDLFTIKTVYVTTPDGASMATDLYLPITSDSLVVDIDIPNIGSGSVELLQNGIQYIYYPTLDSMPNPNPFELPTIMTRTTYGKDDMAILGYIFSVLGYGVAIQDNRGIYNSNDLWMPMYTDGWDKTPYTDYEPELIMPDGYEGNPTAYEDGSYFLDYVLNDWQRTYDLNEDGVVDFTDKASNGSIFYFGASALANSGLLMALDEKTYYDQPGLKGFLNIIATSEHYNNTLFTNGMFRQGLVEGWIDGQIKHFDEDINGTDNSWHNFDLTYSDFGLTTREETLEAFLDLLSVDQAENKAMYYPNSNLRAVFDASRAPVDENGEGDPTGAYSRYTNLDMPVYNATGYYDIFFNGQLDFWRETKKHMNPNSPNFSKQKLIIGPWQHYYPAVQTAGDLTFPENVGDVLGFTANVEGVDGIIESLLNLNLEDLLKSELFSFIRTSANFNEHKNIGTPLIRFPKNERYQQLIGNILIQIPSEDYVTTHAELIKFLGGENSLEFFPADIYLKFNNDTIPFGNIDITIPALPDFITDIFGGISSDFDEFPLYRDFSAIPDVRFYVCGPVNDSVPGNEQMGNYWMEADIFPIVEGMENNTLYLHTNNQLSISAPDEVEEKIEYVHDPNNPVETIGGANLELKTPDDRDNMGPLDLSNPLYAPITMDRDDVVSFETEAFEDSIQLIGSIQAKLFAASLADGDAAGDPTDTDFIVRLVDVYPYGGEYIIAEGNVNARAREYAKSIAEGQEDDDAPITNIEGDKIYEYFFNLNPIAYTFGAEHKLKILISSSNYPRFQSNPNIPINNFDFIRSVPGQSLNYEYEGRTYDARSATNSIHFTPEYPSQIILPLRGRQLEVCGEPDSLFVTNLTDTTAILNWRGASGTSTYLVRYKTVDATTWTEVQVQNTNIEIVDLEAAQYLWEVRSVCQDTTLESSQDTFITTLPTAILENTNNQYGSVYPNPASNYVTLDLADNNWKSNLRVMNNLGQVVKQVTIRSNQTKINIQDLPKGEYIFELLDDENKRLILPFIKL